MLFAKIYNLNLDAFYGQISYYNNTLCIHKNYTAKFFAYISIMYTMGIMMFLDLQLGFDSVRDKVEEMCYW